MVCPVCKKESEKEFRPFCSKRCADIDLNRWLNGQYAINDKGEIEANFEIHLEDERQK